MQTYEYELFLGYWTACIFFLLLFVNLYLLSFKKPVHMDFMQSVM